MRRNPETRLPAVVYVLGLGIFLLGTTEFMIAGLLPELSADLHVSVSQTGLLITGFAVGMALGAPTMAVLTLRLPQRTTLAAALLVFAAGHVVSALATSFTVELAARFVTAVATGTFWAVAAVVVARAAGPGAKARGLAVLIGGLTVANVAGVPLGTLLGQSGGWRLPFWLLAGAAVAMIVVVLPMVPTVPRAPGSAAGPSVHSEFVAFGNRRLWLALATIALLQTGTFGAFSYLSPLLTDVTGLPAGAVPLVLAVFGVGAVIGTTLGGRLGDRWPWSLQFGGMIGVVGTLALLVAFARSAPVTVVLVGLLGVAAFAAAAPLTARVITLAGPAPTLASATSTSAFNVGNSLGPWLGGIAIGTAGLTGPAMVGAVSAAGAVGVALLSVRSDRRLPAAHADPVTTAPPALAAQPVPASSVPGSSVQVSIAEVPQAASSHDRVESTVAC